jgi:hypothetical protein
MNTIAGGFILFQMSLLLLLALFIAGLAGFIIVQKKARLVWRLLSIAVVLVLACQSCSRLSTYSAHTQIQENYMRCGLPCFVENLGKLAVAGRTDEVVRACEKFRDAIRLSSDKADVSNFQALVSETFDDVYDLDNSSQTTNADKATSVFSPNAVILKIPPDLTNGTSLNQHLPPMSVGAESLHLTNGTLPKALYK